MRTAQRVSVTAYLLLIGYRSKVGRLVLNTRVPMELFMPEFFSRPAILFHFIFTALCYASAVLAMGLCLSVCLSVRHKSEFY